MTEGMAADPLGDSRQASRFFDRPLQRFRAYVVSSHDAAAVSRQASRGKDILPCQTPFGLPLPVSVRVLALQGKGQVHRAIPLFRVFLV